jgi:hypothetical protein
MSWDKGFLRFVQQKMKEEAQELDAARVTLRIEGDSLIVSDDRTVDGRLRSYEAAHHIGINVAHLK